MAHISEYRFEIRKDGEHFLPVSYESFTVGIRYYWRVMYRSSSGEVIFREYATGRVWRNGELVIEGVRNGGKEKS